MDLLDLHSLYTDTMGPFVNYIPRMTVFKMILGQSYLIQNESEKLNHRLSEIWIKIPESDKKKVLLDNNYEVFIKYVSDKDLKEDLEYAFSKDHHMKLIKIAFVSWLFTELSKKSFQQALNFYHTGLLGCFWDNEEKTTVKNEFIYNFIKRGVPLNELKNLPLEDFRNPELLYNIIEDNDIPSDIFSWILEINNMNISWHDCAFEKEKAKLLPHNKTKNYKMIDAFPIRVMTDYRYILKDYIQSSDIFEKVIENSPKKNEIIKSDFYKNFRNNYKSSFRELGKRVFTATRSRNSSFEYSIFRYFDFSNINEQKLSFFTRACFEANKLFLLKSGNKIGNNAFKQASKKLQERTLESFMRERQISYSGEDMLIILKELNITKVNPPNLLQQLLKTVICNNDIKSLIYIHKNIVPDMKISELFNYYLSIPKNNFSSTLPNCSEIMLYCYNRMNYLEKFDILTEKKYSSEKTITEEDIDLHFMLLIMQSRENLEFMSFITLLNEKQKQYFSEEGLAKIKLMLIDRVASANNKRNIKPFIEMKKIGITYGSSDIAYALNRYRSNKYIIDFLCDEPVDNDVVAYKSVINNYIRSAYHYQYNSANFNAVFECIEKRYDRNDLQEMFLILKETILELEKKNSSISGVHSLSFYHKLLQFYADIYEMQLPDIPEDINNREKVGFLIKDLDILKINEDKMLINSIIEKSPSLKKIRI